MKKISLFLSLFAIAIMLEYCKSAPITHQYNQEAIALEKEAIYLWRDVQMYSATESERDSLLNIALQHLDEAIAIDSLYISAYGNKAQILSLLGRNRESIKVQKQALKIKEFPEARFILGLTYERMGDTLHARKNYQKALVAYDELLTEEPNSYSLLLNKYFILLFLDADEETLAQMRTMLEAIPDPTGMNMVAELENFDKGELLYDIW